MNTISSKELLFDDAARAQLLDGVNILANAVRVTMGPRGQNVVIENPGRSPHLTKDGVTVAQAVNLRDRFRNLGVQIIKEAASRTAETAGDGTTTATVLTQALFQEGLKMIAAGHSGAELRRGIELASKHVIIALKQAASPVQHDEEIVQVGTISANGDETIGKLLCEALNKVGRDGVVTVEEAKGFETTLEVVEGMQVDRGYVSPYFINNQEKMSVLLDSPHILLTNKKLNSIKDILPILEKVHNEKRSLLIVADEIGGDALQGLVLNKMKGILNVCAIRAPEFGETRLEALQDLGIVLGCDPILSAGGETFANVSLSQLGTCRKAHITKNSCTFVDAAGDTVEIQRRSSAIKEQLGVPGLSAPAVDALTRRLTRLSGGIAIIKVGGATEIELKERKDRVDDALHATKAAIDEGILPGGGVALVRAASKLNIDKITKKKLSSGEKVGITVLRQACSAPLSQIVRNTGGSAELILAKVQEKSNTVGYDARNDEFTDMLECGIVDPLKVVRSALENATSAACMLLSVGCAMIDDVGENDDEPGGLTHAI